MLPKHIQQGAIKPIFLSVFAIATLAFTGCASKPQVQTTRNVIAAPDTYTVRAGDTLGNIASRYGLDYITVAQMNNIPAPYIIHVNQSLRLKGSAAVPVTSTPRPSTPPIQRQSIPLPTPQQTQAPATTTTTASAVPATPANSLRWVKPTKNPIIANFNLASGIKGIRYSGQVGDPVYAAADGQVVYADSGLKEFGNLILIKHSNGYISAYAHNNALLVKSGARVTAGQQIAQMGATGTNRVMLEFQIRASGKAIDPAQIIPNS